MNGTSMQEEEPGRAACENQQGRIYLVKFRTATTAAASMTVAKAR
jgi:hypothetical protein